MDKSRAVTVACPHQRTGVPEPASGRYGTSGAPLSLEQARARIREDFKRFEDLVIGQLALPDGYTLRHSHGLGLEHQLSWNMGCEILSAHAGLSLFGRRIVQDDCDEFQLQIEIRFFHPELHFRRTESSVPEVSREYNNGFGVHLWVDQGRPYWGMNKSLIAGSEFCRDAPSVEALADEVVMRLEAAIGRRTMPAALAAVAN